MAVYLFASRISAAVCVRARPSPPPSPSRPHSAAPAAASTAASTSGRPVCMLQPRRAKPQKKVVLAVATAEVTKEEKEGKTDTKNQSAHPPSENLPHLVYEEGHLRSGTLEALTQLLVPTLDSYPDRGFLFAFLLSSRLFIRPHELLAQVLAACHAQQTSCDKASTAKERLERILPPMVRLLEEWTDMFPYDFRDERMTAAVRGIAQGCDCVPKVRDKVGALLETLLERLTSLERFEKQLAVAETESIIDDRMALPTTDVTEVCGSPVFLAQQLTGLELERMSYVGPEEFVQAFMREHNHPLHQARKTNNVQSYVASSEHLSRLVATEICKQGVKKLRIKMMEFWIDAAKECFNIGNFNSLSAILTGLNMAPVSRLSKTWSKSGSERLSVLHQAMDSGRDYVDYRATLKAAMWRAQNGAASSNIVIPLFPLFVKDIYSLTEPCSVKLSSSHVDMEAVWQLAKTITDFVSWQQTSCPFPRCSKALAYLQVSTVLSDKALMLASFECEVPETSSEKEHYITLKVV